MLLSPRQTPFKQELDIVQTTLLFAYLRVTGLIEGYVTNEFIFFSSQSHTPEVKSDQIIPLCCCVGLLNMSHQGNRWMKSLKDGYLNSQELSASVFLKCTVGILIKRMIRFLFRKSRRNTKSVFYRPYHLRLIGFSRCGEKEKEMSHTQARVTWSISDTPAL